MDDKKVSLGRALESFESTPSVDSPLIMLTVYSAVTVESSSRPLPIVTVPLTALACTPISSATLSLSASKKTSLATSAADTPVKT